MFFEEKAW